jgi:hypothetical protein
MVKGNETHLSPPAAVDFVSRVVPTSITPARATFPFKPASTLIALQHLQADAENRSDGHSCHDAPTVTESTLQQQETFFIEIDEDSTEEISNGIISNPCVVADEIRRTAVAIAGGTILSVGLVLIPFPIIPGSLIAYGGLMLLASEFDSAKQALESVNQAISKWRAVNEVGEVNNVNNESIYDRGNIIIGAMVLDSEDADTSKRKYAGESKQSASGQAPVSPTCQSELFGCGPFISSSFEYHGHDNKNDTTRMTHASFRRLGSNGSISLNTVGTSLGDDSDSFWVKFDCNPFRDHKQSKTTQR